MDRSKRTAPDGKRRRPGEGLLPGIIIHGREEAVPTVPRITAFIWGGKLPVTPTLPYGRLKGAA